METLGRERGICAVSESKEREHRGTAVIKNIRFMSDKIMYDTYVVGMS